jgi:hypothetical protein
MLRRDSERIVKTAEDLSEAASGDRFNAWAYGIVLSLVLAIYGVWSICARSTYFVEGKPFHVVVYRGNTAVALGVTHLCVGLFLNLHFFWSWRARFYGYAQIGKPIVLVGIIASLFYFIFSVLVLG